MIGLPFVILFFFILIVIGIKGDMGEKGNRGIPGPLVILFHLVK